MADGSTIYRRGPWFPVPVALVSCPRLHGLGAVALRVLLVVLARQNMPESGGWALLSAGDIAAIIGHRGHRGVQRALAELLAASLLERGEYQERGGRMMGRARYRAAVTVDASPTVNQTVAADQTVGDGAGMPTVDQTVGATVNQTAAADQTMADQTVAPTVDQTTGATVNQTSAYKDDRNLNRDLTDSVEAADGGSTPALLFPGDDSAEAIPELSADPAHVFETIGPGPRTWIPSARDIADWSACFPGVDVPQSLRTLSSWLRRNPTHRKTAKGLPRWLNAKLAANQDQSMPARRPASESGRSNGNGNGHGGADASRRERAARLAQRMEAVQ
jgi:hypothetical protein